MRGRELVIISGTRFEGVSDPAITYKMYYEIIYNLNFKNNLEKRNIDP